MLKHKHKIAITTFVLVGLLASWKTQKAVSPPITGAPPNGIPEAEVPQDLNPWTFLTNWQRPEGPAKVALQIGHLENAQLPEELSNLHGNTGAAAGGHTELEVNQNIAQLTKEILEAQGVTVELLPATVPPGYWADVFLAIHADGNENTRTTGYKFSGPWRDFTKKSDKLVSFLEAAYEEATDLPKDPNITRNMRGYYAFNWWRYDHAIHPMTTAAIAETGFLTNPGDRHLLTQTPEIPAQALADAIIKYLESENLLKKS